MFRVRIGLMACLLGAAPLSYAAPPPDEQNCARAISMAQAQTKEMQAQARTPRDKEDLTRLKARQEQLIADGRRGGLSECQIWSQLMGAAFNQ